MTALDRAIIRAFHQPSSRSGRTVAEPPTAAPRAAVSAAVPLSQALAELAAAPATATEKLPSTDQPSVGARRGTGSEGSLWPIAVEATTARVGPSIAALLDHAIQATTVTETATVPIGPSIAVSADQTFSATTVTSKTPSPVEVGKTTPAPTEAITATGAPLTSPPSQTGTNSQEPGDTAWRPLLQVDRVVWPSIQNELQTTASVAIGQMADSLLSICASGRKVLGLASCAGGEGVTTLLLAAARELLSQGRKVVLVDANWSNPQLAQSLGLLPQIGWEETLCGGLPLEEVVIESLADGLAVLPVRQPSASTITPSQIAASFDILAREFDVVLVDLGPLAHFEDEDASSHEGNPSHDVAAQMEAVILVQNVRVTTPNRLAEVRGRLAASNLCCAGTIQNFVAG